MVILIYKKWKYLQITLIGAVTSMYINDTSQFYQLENQEENCRANFWYTFFYVQNFLPFADICINWSWFLAADFQLFLVGLTILLIWTRWWFVELIKSTQTFANFKSFQKSQGGHRDSKFIGAILICILDVLWHFD